MVNLKTKSSLLKKMLAFILSMLIVCVSVPLTALAADITDSGNNPAEFGVISGSLNKVGHELHYAKYDGKTYITFCTQCGVPSPTGRVYDRSEFSAYKNKNDAIFKEIAKYIYFGYTMLYGDGLPSNDEEYRAASATQQFVWETLDNAGMAIKCFTRDSWNSSYMSDSIFNDWKVKTDQYINLYYNTLPSFYNSTINMNYRTNTTITDTNGVLQYYPTFDRNVDGVTYRHTKGTNDLTIITTNNVNKHNVLFDAASYGIYMGTPNGIDYNDTMNFVSFEFHSGSVQNLMFSRYVDPPNLLLNVNINWGDIELTKEDIYGAGINGTIFGLFTDRACTNRLATATTTNAKVKFEYLTPGKYFVKELKASDGFLLSDEVIEITVGNGDAVKRTIENDEPTGTITLTKELDVSKTNGKYGDVAISQAEYTIYAKEKITSKLNSHTFYEKDDIVDRGTIKVGENGTVGTITWDNLPLGSYYIKETKAPKGSFIDENIYSVKLTYKNETTPIIVNNKSNSIDVVKSMKVKLFKAGTGGSAGEMIGLQGAEFTIKRNADYERALSSGYTYAEIWAKKSNGKWQGIDATGSIVEVDATRADKANKIAPNYAVITTDENGYALADYLPYGKYITKETVTPIDYMSGADFTFSITQDETEVPVENKVKILNVNNAPYTVPVKMIKKDVDSDKVVTLSSATFKIKATENIYDTGTGKLLFKEGSFVEYKVGTNKYNEFMTNSDSYVVPSVGNIYATTNDTKGTVTTPFKLPAGNYEICEITNPEGFLLAENPVAFTVTSIYDYDKDADGDIVVTVVVKNEQPKAKIIINKNFALRENIDKTLIEDVDYTKVGFELKAAKDIIDRADGDKVYEANEIIGTYFLDEAATLTIENLWMGDYTFKEISTIDGAVLEDTVYEVSFEPKDNTTKIYTSTFNIDNYTTEVDISKTDITNEPEIEGAELTVTDMEGNVVDSWVSTKESHKIEGLVVGNTYTLREDYAPDGYVIANEITFTVQNTKDVQIVKMLDKQVAINKVDVEGRPIVDAGLTVTNTRTKQIVDKWVTTNENHFVNNLIEGETYILTETKTPDNYVTATPLEFTVSLDKEIQYISMIDKQVEVSKVDITTEEELEGAELTVTDMEGNVVDSWTSTSEKHFVSGLEEGKTYVLTEKLAPNGFVTANSVEFTVSTDKQIQTVIMQDKTFEFKKTNVEGELIKGAELEITHNKTKQVVDKWITGQHLFDVTEEMKEMLLEGTTVTDYFINENDSTVKYEITPIEAREDYSLMLQYDGKTDYYIIDINGDETGHLGSGLIEGQLYTLNEVSAPNEYVKAQSIKFEVTNEKVNQIVTMTDKQVEVSKVDITNEEELEGAELTVTDMEGNVVDSWISTKTPHFVTGLVEGEKYILTEKAAPYGYYITENIEFTVTGDKDIQKVIMKDAPILSSIKVNKVDSITKQNIKSNKFAFTLYADAECTKEIITVNANTKEGTAIFEDLRFGTYYIKETKAPKGYELSDEVVEIVINDEGVFANSIKIEELEDCIYSIEYQNSLLPIIYTGDTNRIGMFITIAAILIVGITAIILVGKLNKKKK